MATSLGGRRLVTDTVSLAVLATSILLAAGTTTSAAAAGEEDCAAAFPVDEIERGAPVTGLTVSEGTTPEEFSGETIGVLNDQIAPGVEMILARLTSPEIDRVGGIWAGMSGSPVYAEDGRLVGAVAYGLTWGSSPVAGITPFEDMDDYLGDEAAPARVPVGPKVASKIAAKSDVSLRQAAQGLRPLPVPLGVSGISAQRLDQAATHAGNHRYLTGPARATAGAGARAVDVDADSIIAGGNLAAAMSYGDISLAGTGTATSVCAGRVVGFGHPFSFAGPSMVSLHLADALYIQEDPLGSPFKVANLGGPVGTITDDRLTGITGAFGKLPRTTEIVSDATFEERSREGTTEVNLGDYNAEVAFYQLVSNQENVTDGWIPGSTEQGWRIVGTDAAGKRFSLSHDDRFTSGDITFTSAFELADLVWAIEAEPGVSLRSVDIDSDLTTERDTLRVTGVEQRSGRRWARLGRSAVVKAGSTLRLRVTMSTAAGRTVRTGVALDVPRKAAGTRASLEVAGGGSVFSDAAYRSGLVEIIAAVRSQPRNDEVLALMSFRAAGKRVTVAQTSAEQSLVISGRQRLTVRVR